MFCTGGNQLFHVLYLLTSTVVYHFPEALWPAQQWSTHSYCSTLLMGPNTTETALSLAFTATTGHAEINAYTPVPIESKCEALIISWSLHKCTGAPSFTSNTVRGYRSVSTGLWMNSIWVHYGGNFRAMRRGYVRYLLYEKGGPSQYGLPERSICPEGKQSFHFWYLQQTTVERYYTEAICAPHKYCTDL